MQTVILAGGLATRLRPLTQRIPKSMMRIDDKPFLEYQIELLRKSGIEDLVLCVGHLGELIRGYFGDGKKCGVRIKYSFDGEGLLGTGGALKKAEDHLEKEFFLMYGDSYLHYDYQDIKGYFQKRDKLSLLVVYKNENKYDKSNVIIKDGLVKKYDKNDQGERKVYIDSGLCVMRRNALELVPKNRFFDLGSLYRKLIEQEQMLAYEVQKRFYQIGSFPGLKEFEELIKEGVI